MTSASIRVNVRPEQLASLTGATLVDRLGVQSGVWTGAPVPGPELITGGGPSARLDRVDDWGEIPGNAAFALPAVTLRLYIQPLSTPAYTTENQEKFLIANSRAIYKGPGSFSVERKLDRLAVFVVDQGGVSQWFDGLPDGLPHAVMPVGFTSCIELIQGPGGAKLRLNGAVVAHMPTVTASWATAAAAPGIIIGAWTRTPVARILVDAYIGPIEVFPFEMPDDRLPPMPVSGPPLPPPPPPPPPVLG